MKGHTTKVILEYSQWNGESVPMFGLSLNYHNHVNYLCLCVF